MFASVLRNIVLKNQKRPWLVAKKYLAREVHAVTPSLISQDRQLEYKAMLPEIVSAFTEAIKTDEMKPFLLKMMSHLFQQEHDSLLTTLTIASYESLQKPENLTPENIKPAIYLAYILGVWKQSFAVYEDVVNGSNTRLGVPCWHKMDVVEFDAVVEVMLLEQLSLKLFRKYFLQRSWYWPALHLLQDSVLRMTMGNSMDVLCRREGGLPLSQFTMEKVNNIADYKDGGFVYIPMILGLYMSSKYDENLHKQIQRIGRKAAIHIQHKDDFEDCFGRPEQIGNDLQKGRCSWVVAKALELANPKQREIIDKNFGRPDPDACSAVMDVYKELQLEEVYQQSKKDFLDDMQMELPKISQDQSIQNLLAKFQSAFV